MVFLAATGYHKNEEGQICTNQQSDLHLPDDILYLSEIDSIDVNTFISEKGNHITEHLAIHSYTAMELGRTAFWDFLCAAQAGTLIRGLLGLETLHIIEGEYAGAEKCPPHWETIG
jgi:hypothetical protein